MYIIPANTNLNHFYVVLDPTGVIYAGVGKIADVFTLARLKAFREFDLEVAYKVEILSSHVRLIDAQNALSSWIRQNGVKPPKYNMAQATKYVRGIYCVETGKTYKSQTDAAADLNISQSALSQHLNRVPGHKSIKGLTFNYLTTGD